MYDDPHELETAVKILLLDEPGLTRPEARARLRAGAGLAAGGPAALGAATPAAGATPATGGQQGQPAGASELPQREQAAARDQEALTAELEAPFRALFAKVDRDHPGFSNSSRSHAEALLEAGEALDSTTIRDVVRRAFITQKTGKVVWFAESGATNEHGELKFPGQLVKYSGSITVAAFDEYMAQFLTEYAEHVIPEGGRVAAKDVPKARAAMASGLHKDTHGALNGLLYGYLSRERQAAATSVSMDIWADEDLVHFPNPNEAAISQRFTGLPLTTVDEALADRVMADFFIGPDPANPRIPGGFGLLWQIAAARVAQDRREAYVHLRALSNFGKSMLLDALGDGAGEDCQPEDRGLGIVAKMSAEQVEQALEGQPSGLNRADFTRAWIVWFDEFSKVKAEYKQLTHSLRFSPKNQMEVTVPLYTKFFTSAEHVNSLIGSGVEKQCNQPIGTASI